jgi:hypothetical protein
MCIPAQFVVGPRGAAGTPAQILAMLLSPWWRVAMSRCDAHTGSEGSSRRTRSGHASRRIMPLRDAGHFGTLVGALTQTASTLEDMRVVAIST